MKTNNKALFLFFTAIILCTIVYVFYHSFSPALESLNQYRNCPYRWNGGDPSGSHQGSCWCGKQDNYCMCTPSLAVEAIVEYNPKSIQTESAICDECKIILVIRRDSPGKSRVHAIPGGFVNLGETTDTAVIRELKEETNLSIQEERLEQFKMFSDVMKDHRRQTATLVYRYTTNDLVNLHSGDDAKDLVQVNLKDILKLNLAFDHRKVLSEYLRRYHPKLWETMQVDSIRPRHHLMQQ